MDYMEVKQIFREELHRWLEHTLEGKKCPECGTITTMVKVFVEPPEGAPELAPTVLKWRCLNCLGLFTEELTRSK